jgi:hypothetical protein
MFKIEIASIPPSEYEGDYSSHLFDQYKLYVEMADRISSRRQAANTFFLSINTLLVTAAGYAKSADSELVFFHLLTAAAGLIICYCWYRLVLSYKDLNSAKFKVIHEIERFLPLKLYDGEWDAVGRGEVKALYHPFTDIEIRIPWIFFALYLTLILSLLPWTRVMA